MAEQNETPTPDNPLAQYETATLVEELQRRGIHVPPSEYEEEKVSGDA
jgi:hypothetical protein